MSNLHQNLASGAWGKLTLCEQMGNIGSEVGRTLRSRDENSKNHAFERALELFDLTTADSRRKRQLTEILRVKELFISAKLGKPMFNTTLEDLDRYFLNFALAARAGK